MTRLEKFIYAKEVANWTCDINGNVYNKNNKKIGSSNNGLGYVESSLCKDGKKFNIRFHQFIYWYFTNELPEQIDHIDRDRKNNRLENLQASNNRKNSYNKKAKGFSFNKKTNKYHAKIGVNYKTISLGLFNSPDEASIAYLNFKKKLVNNL